MIRSDETDTYHITCLKCCQNRPPITTRCMPAEVTSPHAYLNHPSAPKNTPLVITRPNRPITNRVLTPPPTPHRVTSLIPELERITWVSPILNKTQILN